MTRKVARCININMRSTEQEKLLLQKAAELAGFSNLTNFIMTAARKEATRVLSDMHVSYIPARAWQEATTLIENPPEPNQALKKLLNKKDAG